jgi:putative colanic acid biosynthesis acetyltransferase WcaF
LGDYNPRKSLLIRAVWFLLGSPIVSAKWLPLSLPRRGLLRLFGAKIGRGVILRPRVRVKNPWMLTVGEYSMIGEDVWIDNLAPITIGSHVCISQGAYLCTGNHDWSSPSFRYRLGEIHIGHGAWIGAKAIVGPGVSIGECAVVCLGSVAIKDIGVREIHAGNPAAFVRQRTFYSENDSPAKRRRPSVRW